ncbi:MAG: hypothetical protein KBF98_06225, partial [Rhodoferax sp.]|nr:hypothetical protein [Rhodoferax sp.]
FKAGEHSPTRRLVLHRLKYKRPINKNAMVACEDQPPRSGLVQLVFRDAEITNIPFLAVLADALRRCNPLV